MCQSNILFSFILLGFERWIYLVVSSIQANYQSGKEIALNVSAKQTMALFLYGCFWHGCPVHANMPKNNQEFWEKKLLGNKARDRFVTRELRKMGWRVVRVWEHELKIRVRVAAKITHAIDIARG